MNHDYLAAAYAAGKAAFASDPEAPQEQHVRARYGRDVPPGLDGIEFARGWRDACDAYLAGLTPRGRSLYRFRCRDRLDDWQRSRKARA